jgi:hypothetical protein
MERNTPGRKLHVSVAEVGSYKTTPKLSKSTEAALSPQEVSRFYGWINKKPETPEDQEELRAIVTKITALNDLNDKGVLIEMKVNHSR